METLGRILLVVAIFVGLAYAPRYLDRWVANSDLVKQRAPHVLMMNEGVAEVERYHAARRSKTPPER
jgi:hypothetical protein